jgi:chromosomal replication initiator protein
MNEYNTLWNQCLHVIESNVSKANFNTWFKNTSLVKKESGVIFIGVPNEFVRDWISNKFHTLILQTLINFSEDTRNVEYLIVKFDRPNLLKGPSLTDRSRELPLHDLYVNKEDNLNPKYTFDSLVVGPFNEMAFAAANAVVDKPGLNYNPYFIYGDTGLGKTHLIQSIGNAIKEKHKDKKVIYTTLEKFATELVTSFTNNSTNSFKEKFRKFDVLIVDDIQFVGKMEKTQEELFHLFNTLYEKGKQIIFSSDKHPNFIHGLEDRLRSRFQAGMIIDINQPEFESRLAILREKAKISPIELTEDVLSYMAEIVQGNVRELEGSLNTVVCHGQLKNKTVTLNDVKCLIKNSIKPKKQVVVKDIVKAVSGYYNIDENSIYEKTRRKEIVKVRQLVMYILREFFNVSYPLIGQKLGGKDHTTVIHSYLKIKDDLKTNPLLAQEIEQLKIMFK